MRILITNDDGIGASVLPHLVRWAMTLGEVTVAVPKTEQSGKSQAINFTHPVEIKRADIGVPCEVWAVDSTPADCVRFAVTGLGRHYDLVLSGINRGYNLGHDIVYSGTVAAIYEASRLGLRAIALSTGIDTFEPAMEALNTAYDYIGKRNLFAYTDLLNVNLPTQKPLGIRITRQGGPFFTDGFIPCGDDRYLQVGEHISRDGDDPRVDMNAIDDGYISITPMTIERTNLPAFEAMLTDGVEG